MDKESILRRFAPEFYEPYHQKKEIERKANVARADAEARIKAERHAPAKPKPSRRGRPTGVTPVARTIYEALVACWKKHPEMAAYCAALTISTPLNWQKRGCPKTYDKAWTTKEWKNSIYQQLARARRALSR